MANAARRPVEAPVGKLVFSDAGNYGMLSRQHRAGRAAKLAPGVYVTGGNLPVEDLARHHLWQILAHFWPGAVVCDRSALHGGIADGWVFICHPDPPRRADLRLPGVAVSCRIGPGPLPGDMEWPHGLHLSGAARGLVENIASGGRPAKGRPARSAGTEQVGDRVDSLARSGDPGKIQDTLAQLDQISAHFNQAAVRAVRELLAAVLGTVSDTVIASSLLAARVSGEPYDAARAKLFEEIRQDLDTIAPSVRPVLGNPDRRYWLPFFDAYFSNYIEGTVFSVDEARRIAIDDEVPAARPADAHDVSATFRIVTDPIIMREAPTSFESFIDILRARHRVLMAARPDRRPGHFKVQQNVAGGTAFVAPDHLAGTLRAGWDVLDDIVDPFHRAVMMMFLVTECHPFDDGNGRLARILANTELAAREQVRIVIPTSYRGNYLAALAAATHNASGHALASVLDFARRWVSVVDWSEWDTSLADLEASNAFTDAVIAEQSGDRLRLPR